MALRAPLRRHFLMKYFFSPSRQWFTAKFVVSRSAFCKLRKDFGFFFSVKHLIGGGGVGYANNNATRSPSFLTRRGKTEPKMTREYLRKLRWSVVFLLREGWGVADIVSVLRVGETFVRKIQRIFKANHSIEYRPRQGNLKRLSGD